MIKLVIKLCERVNSDTFVNWHSFVLSFQVLKWVFFDVINSFLPLNGISCAKLSDFVTSKCKQHYCELKVEQFFARTPVLGRLNYLIPDAVFSRTWLCSFNLPNRSKGRLIHGYETKGRDNYIELNKLERQRSSVCQLNVTLYYSTNSQMTRNL